MPPEPRALSALRVSGLCAPEGLPLSSAAMLAKEIRHDSHQAASSSRLSARPSATGQTLAANGITPAAKSLYLDVGNLLDTLDPLGRFFGHDKLEGVSVVNVGGSPRVVISNDSDFSIDGLSNSTPPFQLHAKVTPAGVQDDGEYLVIDPRRVPAQTSAATVTFHVVALTNITSQVSQTRNGPVFNRAAGTSTVGLTITNTSGSSVTGAF